MSPTDNAHSSPLSRAFSRLFHRDANESNPATAHAPQQVVPRVVTAPPAASPVVQTASSSPTTTSANGAQADIPMAPTPPTPSSTVAPTPSARQRTYTVQQGDSLSKIAQQLYGDANRWPLLFDANRERIADPDRIYAGQVLMVPDPPLH